MGTSVATLAQRSGRLDTDGVDFGAFAARPLDPATLRCLRYMHDVEHHTMCYLRDLLVTSAHADPDITAFLAVWSYEEHWHGDAIAQVLRVHGEPAGSERVASLRRALPRRDRFRPLLYLVGSALTRHMVTVQMAWGAVNEWTTQAGYGRLAARAGHPVLTDLLRRIMKQEGRHIDFYTAQAQQRLGGHPTAQRVTRKALQRFWSPVGAGVMPPAEVRFLAHHLFSGPEGVAAAQRVDRQIARLPGLGGLQLVERAVGGVSRPARSVANG
jgi:hypothetical protein